MKKELAKLKKEVGHCKKLCDAYLSAMVAMSYESRHLRDDVAAAFAVLVQVQRLVEARADVWGKECVEQFNSVLSAVLGPPKDDRGHIPKLEKKHCNNGLQCIQTFPKGVNHKPSCICICPRCRP